MGCEDALPSATRSFIAEHITASVHTASAPSPPARLALGLRLSAGRLSVCRPRYHRPPASPLCVEGAAFPTGRPHPTPPPSVRPRGRLQGGTSGKESGTQRWDSRGHHPSPWAARQVLGGQGHLPPLAPPQRLLEDSVTFLGTEPPTGDRASYQACTRQGSCLGGRVTTHPE